MTGQTAGHAPEQALDTAGHELAIVDMATGQTVMAIGHEDMATLATGHRLAMAKMATDLASLAMMAILLAYLLATN